MNSLIPLERIERLLQLEPVILILGLSTTAWVIYRLLLRDVSSERHRNLQSRFSNVAYHLVSFALLTGIHYALHFVEDAPDAVTRIQGYLGLVTLVQGAIVFVKICRIFLFEYLFLSHMKVGVPVLLVNLFTLALSLVLFAWLATEIFNVRLTPLLATSAIFSLVLGLALQDTLGNLFAGVALQIDKPYEIGDWIEIQSGGQKWVGQVNEITWRATVLFGIGDESITIPNRIVSQAQVANYSARQRPIIRSQVFRIPYSQSIDPVKKALLDAAASVPAIRKDVPPLVFVGETHESWVPVKLIYYISDFGAQFSITDQVTTAALAKLDEKGIALSSSRIAVLQDHVRA